VRTRAARLALGAALAGLTLWLALRGTDTAALTAALGSLHPGWLLASLASVLLTLALGILRWRVLIGEPAPWGVLADGYVVGQAINILLPIRLGEVARAYIASRGANLPVARALTTIAVEKLVDLAIAARAMALLLMLVALPDWAVTPGRALVMTGALAALAALLALNRRALPLLTRAVIRLAPAAWRPRLERQLGHAADGLAGLRTWKASTATWGLTALVFLAAVATNQLLFVAFDLALPFVAAVTLILALQVGTSLASVPGNLGVFHYVTILVLAAYGVPHDTALACALVLYAVAIVPKLLFGVLRISMAYGWSAMVQGART
jgi:glycosyltransferase 2 family protein